MLAGEPFKAILAQPGLGTRQPVEVGQVVAILMRFPAGFPGRHRDGGLAGGSQALPNPPPNAIIEKLESDLMHPSARYSPNLNK